MSEITKLDPHSQGTTRDKYKVIARAKAMRHDDVLDHLTNHMLLCDDPDCNICDMGQGGELIDDGVPEADSRKTYNIGDRSSEGREGAGDIDTLGERSAKDLKGDRENLMKHGEHLTRNPAGPKHIPGPVSKASSKIMGARNAKGINLKHGSKLPRFHVGGN